MVKASFLHDEWKAKKKQWLSITLPYGELKEKDISLKYIFPYAKLKSNILTSDQSDAYAIWFQKLTDSCRG